MILRTLPCILLALAASSPARSAELLGAGASLPSPVYLKWAEAYQANSGHKISYQSIGSGGGVKEAAGKSIDFGATDVPLSAADLERRKLLQFPALVGGAVPIVNLPGLKASELRLSGPVLAEIYLGRITRWDDKRIRAINSGVSLPDLSIAVVHRGDGAGTTYIFTDYLTKVHQPWRERVGSGTTVSWPLGLHAKGDEGMQRFVGNLPGAIGYVDYAFARNKQLEIPRMLNRAGNAVAADDASLKAAAADVNWAQAGWGAMLTDQPGANAWPITGATFIVMLRQTDKPASASETLKFFQWAYKNGYALAQANGYVALPETTIDAVQMAWQKITDTNGQPVFN